MEKPFALIVEDQQDIVALFQQVLDLAGYHTEIVMDGSAAMRRIRAGRPDVVLLDLQLPGMTGVEILKAMRTDESLAAIPVVVITAYANYSTRLPYEPDLFLLKPVNIMQLSNLVQRLQATRGPRQELVHDPITGLYTTNYFNERSGIGLERVRRGDLLRIGILFVEFDGFAQLKHELAQREWSQTLRALADQFSLCMRPLDTKAASAEQAYFLALLEEIPSNEGALKIADRVQNSLDAHARRRQPDHALRARVGILICDSKYADVAAIMKDLDQARLRLRVGESASPAVFDHKLLLTQT